MFSFAESYEFEWPVEVRTPDGGKFIVSTFIGHFKMVPEDELWDKPEVGSYQEFIEVERSKLRDVFLGWPEGEIIDDASKDGKTPLAATRENIDRLLRNRHVRIGIADAVNAAILRGEAREKN